MTGYTYIDDGGDYDGYFQYNNRLAIYNILYTSKYLIQKKNPSTNMWSAANRNKEYRINEF